MNAREEIDVKRTDPDGAAPAHKPQKFRERRVSHHRFRGVNTIRGVHSVLVATAILFQYYILDFVFFFFL